MIEIKPGPELDRAVAEAVDPWCTVDMCDASGCLNAAPDASSDVLAVWKWNGERNWILLPKFSTDLNAAFEAAEKIALFNSWRVLRAYRYHWEVYRLGDPPTLDETIAEGATPALAICAAILKLKENQ